MKTSLAFVGLVVSVILSGCAHGDKEPESFTVFPGPSTIGGITYYPAHPGTTNYGVVDYTTNPPPAGVKPFVLVVTTNGNWRVRLIDGNGHASTNTLPSK